MMVFMWVVSMLAFIAVLLGGTYWLLKDADKHIDSEPELRYTVYSCPLGSKDDYGYEEEDEVDTIEEVRKLIEELKAEGRDYLVWDNSLKDWHNDA